jgi:hypothetical protein
MQVRSSNPVRICRDAANRMSIKPAPSARNWQTTRSLAGSKIAPEYGSRPVTLIFKTSLLVGLPCDENLFPCRGRVGFKAGFLLSCLFEYEGFALLDRWSGSRQCHFDDDANMVDRRRRIHRRILGRAGRDGIQWTFRDQHFPTGIARSRSLNGEPGIGTAKRASPVGDRQCVVQFA